MSTVFSLGHLLFAHNLCNVMLINPVLCFQRKEMNLEKKESLLLSLFAYPILGTDNYTHKEVPQNFSTSYAKNSNKSSSIPINDLITSLYNEADQNTSVNQIGKASNGQINSSVVESDLIVSDDEFDDSSWEFKDASCRDEDKNSSSALALGESCTTVVSRSELNECIELYCKLKDALCSIVLRHIDNLQVGRLKTEFTFMLSYSICLIVDYFFC